MRNLLVFIHAASGVAGLFAGLPVIAPPAFGSRITLRRVYLFCLAVLFGSLVLLVAVDWGGLETGARLAFSGLTALAGVMVFRVAVADRLASTRDPGWEMRYIGHVYFSYIALWIGLAIVPALNTDHPQLWVPVAVVGPLGAGGELIGRYKRRLADRLPPLPS